MVRLGCINDDCDAEPVELHLSDELKGNYEVLSKFSVQCSCGYPRTPENHDLEAESAGVLAGSWARFADDYLDDSCEFTAPA
ncbi:hypothetical protein ABSL23_02225 [Halobacterium sp. NMX12-1]|uniref:Uncharacterized protein n=1 Tax=Halobacterium sp. NMX12-1 TaxID=3166650 RepID=A0AAU8CD70_9EURY